MMRNFILRNCIQRQPNFQSKKLASIGRISWFSSNYDDDDVAEPVYNASYNYSGNSTQNPSYKVAADNFFTDEEIKTLTVPLLTNQVKEEMYRKFVDDGWDYVKISNHYKTSLERTKGVILLYGFREDLLRQRGLLCYVPVRTGEVESEEDKLQRQRSKIWEDIYHAYQADKTEKKETAQREKAEADKAAEAKMTLKELNRWRKQQKQDAKAALKDVKGARAVELEFHKRSVADLAVRFSVAEEEVELAVQRMTEHFERMDRVRISEEAIEEVKSELDQNGVPDVDTFREVPQHPVPMHLRQNYFPELFEDDQFHQHRKNLLRRLFTDTRAKPLDTEDYLRKFGDDDDDSVKQGGEGGEAGQEEDENIRQLRKKGVLPPFLPPPALCRYKVAFRDLSKGKDTPTVVRTRTGKFRLATPLEEFSRSWAQRPSPVDMELNKHKVAKYHNYDGDDHVKMEVINAWKARRSELKEKHAAKAKN